MAGIAGMTERIGLLTRFKGNDLHDLCDATEAAIEAGGGFGWLAPPERPVLESYWKGALLVPRLRVFVARLDGVICGSAQLLRPAGNNEAQAFSAQLQHAFVAPWARGHGLARALTLAVEEEARRESFTILILDVRETQEAAIKLYDSLGFTRWGTNPFYARVDGRYLAGYHYLKPLDAGVTTGAVTAAAWKKAAVKAPARAKKKPAGKISAKTAAKKVRKPAKKTKNPTKKTRKKVAP